MKSFNFGSDKSYPWYTLFYRRGHLLILSLLVLVTAGLSALGSLPRIEDPRIDTRNALIITQYPGASAERVEALVSDVLEDRLREIFEIKEVKSTSRAGISIILIETQDWINNSSNEQLFSEIRDAIGAAAESFPEGAMAPVFDEKRGATAFTLLLSVRADHFENTPITLTARLAQELTDRLRNVNGTELVRVYGAPQEEISVNIDPIKLAATGLTLQQVSNLISRADPKLPAGMLNSQQSNLRFAVGEGLNGVNMIALIPLVNEQGRYLRVEDIATVERSFTTPRNEVAFLNGEESIFVAARMQPSLRSDVWTENALAVVEQFNKDFSGTLTATVAFEQNEYTATRLADLSMNLLMGCAVVMMVILLFMGFRAAWIVGLALPLCAAFALFSLSFYDEQIHQMSIFGMIIAIGLLIDNAIVITDEIRINLQDPNLTRVGAMAKSVSHLFVPLLASTLTTILVKNKTRDIGILKSIGVQNFSIKKIFFLVGFIIGTSATLFGVIIGTLFSIYIENIREFISSLFNISLFPEEIYFLSTLPSEINIQSIFLISICSIFTTIIVSIYPAFKASKLDTVKTLKYE